MASMLSGVNPWFAALPLIVGVFFMGTGVGMLQRSRRRRRTWTRRTGLVVGSRLFNGQIESQVTFSDDSGPVTFWNRFTTSFTTDPVGRTVDVLVNPDDRSDAVVANGPAAPSIVAGVFVAFGLVAVLAGAWLLAATLGAA
jgi:hypothetical protein